MLWSFLALPSQHVIVVFDLSAEHHLQLDGNKSLPLKVMRETNTEVGGGGGGWPL